MEEKWDKGARMKRRDDKLIMSHRVAIYGNHTHHTGLLLSLRKKLSMPLWKVFVSFRFVSFRFCFWFVCFPFTSFLVRFVSFRFIRIVRHPLLQAWLRATLLLFTTATIIIGFLLATRIHPLCRQMQANKVPSIPWRYFYCNRWLFISACLCNVCFILVVLSNPFVRSEHPYL